MKRKLRTISCQQAHEIIETDPRALLVDVRSGMEFLFVGHPSGAINIPWIDEPDWVVNPAFATEIRKLLLGGTIEHGEIHSAPVVLICRSGKRSAEAGELLVQEGFTTVYNVDEGFEGELDGHHHRSSLGGWRYHDLPWEQC
ncbi:MAG: rhodanese-like domain-containing protein [Proteobacteria bacterium]|jgi:rhodanese-related sulfurtransferase|nr:rhodanese-like domain-containing protein [Pseudomonadota bacterium]MCG6934568.1 rhodanese-like domain-containing protein [Pseudomonadota bacterium]